MITEGEELAAAATHIYQRNRMLVIAVWLIGLGTVFLVRDLASWTWGQAWPLWVILVGAGSTASTLLSGRRPSSIAWSVPWSLAVTAVGVVLLLSTTGAIALTPAQLLAWWPVVVVALGAWFIVGALVVRPPTEQSEMLSLPLAGAPSADVRIRFGGGELNVGPAEPGALVAGRFGGGVAHRLKGPGSVELEPESMWPFGWGGPLRWDVGLTTEVPLDLSLETGANRSAIDLSGLRIRNLRLQTGASDTRVRMPSTGVTSVRSESGVASLAIEVPAGVAARIRSKMALGDVSIDSRRFPRTADGWASPDYESAANRVDIDIAGGLGSVRVT